MNLLNFFGKKRDKPDIHWVQVPDIAWQKVQDEPGCIRWEAPGGASNLSVNFFDMPPDISVPLSDIDGLRNQYREALANVNGGLIKLEVELIQDILVVDLILKVPMKPFGMSYIGSMTIPFKEYSYVIKIEAAEQGMTGVRDSTIANKLIANGTIEIGEKGFEGWFKDPYSENYKGGILMNLSEGLEYDADFPLHPLSVVRSRLKFIKENIQFHKGIFDLASF